MLDFLNDLNESQLQAVNYCDGPQLVIAGAGSGKTRVLTYKIAYLLEQKKIAPWEILALTFTNKAANEMKDRIGELVGISTAHRLRMGTFHSVFSRILRAEAEQIGYTSAFTIYDETDSRSLIKSIVKELDLDDKTYKPGYVHTIISLAKNRLITSANYTADMQKRDEHNGVGALYKIFRLYEQRLRVANSMDFDDLLLHTFFLFRDHEIIREKYENAFKYILIDEYQDTNFVQQSIIKLLTKQNRHLCVVGDDAQSIYAFRGAEIDNILGFQHTYQDARLFKLEQNYRSTSYIVQVANSLISHNTRQIQKNVFSLKQVGNKLICRGTYSDREEANVVSKYIKAACAEQQMEPKDFAILYRTNAQSRVFEEEFRRQNLAYRIFGGISFYQRKEIKDIIAYFRLVVNPYDEEAFKRIINYPTRGIGDTTMKKIISYASSHELSLWNVCTNESILSSILSRSTVLKIKAFCIQIDSFHQQLSTKDAYNLGQQIVEIVGLKDAIFKSTKDPEALSVQENVSEFINSIKEYVDLQLETNGIQFVTLTNFLQEISLVSEKDSKSQEDNCISLMTIHSAKGLEFPVVFIVGLEESILPSSRVSNIRELEEERRLLYVAITRAKEQCILTYTTNRFKYGKMEFCNPSRFIKELDNRYIQFINAHDQMCFVKQVPMPSFSNQKNALQKNNQNKSTIPFRSIKRIDINAQKFSENEKCTASEIYNVRIGSIIEHQRFGIGKVVSLQGKGEEIKASIDFKNVGMKQLLLKFAKFNVLD